MLAYVAHEGVVSSVLGEGRALLHTETNTYFTLNRVGGFIWDLLLEPRAPEELVDMACRTFDVDQARCALDVTKLLESMKTAGLIEETQTK